MERCPNCQKLAIFPGATDCPRCGYVLRSEPEPPAGPEIFGNPLYPQYREPPPFVPFLLAVLGTGMVIAGVWIAMTPGEGSCSGKGGTLCVVAAWGSQLLSGKPNLRIAEASVWIAFGLGSLAAAWHLHTMWHRKGRA